MSTLADIQRRVKEQYDEFKATGESSMPLRIMRGEELHDFNTGAVPCVITIGCYILNRELTGAQERALLWAIDAQLTREMIVAHVIRHFPTSLHLLRKVEEGIAPFGDCEEAIITEISSHLDEGAL